MDDVLDFFKKKSDFFKNKHINIPMNFSNSLLTMYDFQVSEEIKKCLYEYNEEQIEKDILNYLHAINMDIGQEDTCPWTKEKITASNDFFHIIETKLFGKKDPKFRDNLQKKYTQETLQEMKIHDRDIKATKLFGTLKSVYISMLKDTSIDALKDNSNFRDAIFHLKDEEKFESYDEKIKYNVRLLISRLQDDYGYTEQSAIKVSICALDSGIFNK